MSVASQYAQPPKGGDAITGLPIDKNPPTTNEIHLVNSLFSEPNKTTLQCLMGDMKDTILIAILFVLFSLPQVDELIHRLIPATSKSPYILLGIKALLVASSWWIIRYFYLSRQK